MPRHYLSIADNRQWATGWDRSRGDRILAESSVVTRLSHAIAGAMADGRSFQLHRNTRAPAVTSRKGDFSTPTEAST